MSNRGCWLFPRNCKVIEVKGSRSSLPESYCSQHYWIFALKRTVDEYLAWTNRLQQAKPQKGQQANVALAFTEADGS